MKIRIAVAILLPLLVLSLALPASSLAGLPLGGSQAIELLPVLPLDLAGTLTTNDTAQADADTDPYGGYGNGSIGQADLPQNLGTIDLGLSSSEINSAGAIVEDWPGTPQDESKATAASVVEVLGIHDALGTGNSLSLGSAGSSAPPATGLVGSIGHLKVPGVGEVFLAYYRTESKSGSTGGEMNVLLVRIEALDLDLAIPVMQSQSSSEKSGDEIESTGSSDLLASKPNESLVVGDGIVGGEDAAAVKILSAGSRSRADGNQAETGSYWTLADIAAGGNSVIGINDHDGAMVLGTEVVPAGDSSGESFMTVEPLPGVAGVHIGEMWSGSDGKSYAYSGSNILRVSLLDRESFLVLGHAASGANAVFATGPGSGSDQDNEGPQGSNPGPETVSPPNDRPIAIDAPDGQDNPDDGDGGIGPPPDEGENPEPGEGKKPNPPKTEMPPEFSPPATAPPALPPGGPVPNSFTTDRLPATGITVALVFANFIIAMFFLMASLLRSRCKRRKGLVSGD